MCECVLGAGGEPPGGGGDIHITYVFYHEYSNKHCMEKLTVKEPFFAIFVVSRPYHVLRSERGPARERKTGYVLFDSNMSSISLYNILHIENVNITIKYAYGHTTQNKENL